MWFRHRAWIPIGWALSGINLVAVWFAAQPAEPMHATIHALLAGAFALGAQHLAARRRAEGHEEDLQQALDQNEQLQHTVADMRSHQAHLEERLDFAEHLHVRQASERLTAPSAEP